MEKIIKDEEKFQGGAAVIKDVNNDVIKDDNRFKGQNIVNEQFENSSKIRDKNYSYSSYPEKSQVTTNNNSRYGDTGYTHNQDKRNEHNNNTRSSKNTDYQRNTQSKGEKVIVSTGTAAAMINEKGSAKDAIKSADHKKQGYISMIKNPESEIMINDKLKGLITQSQTSGTTEGIEQYKQSKITPRYKRDFNNMDNDILLYNTDETGNETAKHSIYQVVRTPKYTLRTYRTGKKLLSSGRYTIKSAAALTTGRTTLGNILKNRRNEIYKTQTGLTTTAKEAIIGFKGGTSEDLGIQTVVKTKDTIVQSSRVAKQTYKAGKAAARFTKKATKNTLMAGKKAAKTAQNVAYTVKSFARPLMNPFLIKAIIILAAVTTVMIAAIAAVSSVLSIFSFLTFGSDKNDLTETHKYITVLDTELLLEINNAQSFSKWKGKDNYQFYIDYGTPIAVDLKSIVINTDTTKLIAYLTTKYDDFKFSDVKDEIETIHSQLYKIVYKEWDEQVSSESTSTDPKTGKVTTTKSTKTVKHLDITLKGLSFEEWLSLYGNLDKSQKERYDSSLVSGGTMMLRSYGSPFIETDWRPLMSSRFGYRVDPVKGGKEFHNGIDIPMPIGTKINSVSEGTASLGYDASGYGNYVTITYTYNKNTEVSFIYAHCDKILVTDGQAVKKGDVIATVGSTGKSTGSHLHITYKIDGKEYNPEFYLE